MKGFFITFEGPESCGKSTQARLLYRFLKGKGFKVVFLREPGGTQISEKVRKILLDKQNSRMDPRTELLLYMASRAQTVAEVIKPALSKGAIVLCDRFLDSTVVYQGYGLGIDVGLIKQMGAYATAGISPDLTVLLDAPIESTRAKIWAKKDRIESRAYAYHKRVKNGYTLLARQDRKRIRVVKLCQDKSATQAAIRQIVCKRLKVQAE